MKQTVSFPLDAGTLEECGSWETVRREVHGLGCDGLEGIWAGEDFPPGLPEEMIVGYHLTFFLDWLDLYREDHAALERKFGTMENVHRFYGGTGRNTLLELYRADLERAAALKPEYVVFHVSDVSVEESYTYRWLHSHEEVIDAAAEIINTLLDGRDWPFEFLMENQWWPGFTFTAPKRTARLLDRVQYGRKGILLDTGHLMNTNTKLRTQAEGAAYILQMVEKHGDLAQYIHGIHLHQSLSGKYVESHTGALPADYPLDPMDRFSVGYEHVLQIDRHEPWTDNAILPVLERIGPRWVTHELASSSWAQKKERIVLQTKFGLAYL